MTSSLTDKEHAEVLMDLTLARTALARHEDTEPLPGLETAWRERRLAWVREIERLREMLEEQT